MDKFIPSIGIEYSTRPKNHTNYSLLELQVLVGGYIEVVEYGDPKDILIVNEEGLLKSLPLNTTASLLAGRTLVGNVVQIARSRLR